MSGQPERPSPAARALMAMVTFTYRHSAGVVLAGVILAVAALYYAYTSLDFLTDRSQLVREDEKYLALHRAFRAEFPETEDVVVVVEGGTAREREAFVDDLAGRLRREPSLFKDVFGRFDMPFLRTQALLYLDVGDLQKLVDELEDAHDLLVALGSKGGLPTLMNRFGSREGASPEKLSRMLPFLNKVMELLLESLKTRGRYAYESPWQSVFFGDVPETAPEELQGAGRSVFYNTVNKGEVHLLLLRQNRKAPIETVVDRLREIVTETHRSHPNVHSGLTGEPLLEVDEMRSSTQDSLWATGVSLFLVAVLYIWAFREVIRPLMVMFVLVLSLAWTIGYTTFAIGHLNLLTVTFGTILVGLGVDFGIHFLYRFEEERLAGVAPLEAMKIAMAGTGVENLTGAVSMAVAFWAIRFMDFRGVAELGDITGVGVMLCFVGMITVLPALVFLQIQLFNPPPRVIVHEEGLMAKWERGWLARPWMVVGPALVATALCATQLYNIRFDYNLLNMQSPRLESVKTELQLIHNSEHSVLFAISVADDLDAAERLTKKFELLPTVSMVESFLPLVPRNYEAKALLVRRVEELMRDVRLPEVPQEIPGGSSLSNMADGFLELEAAFNTAYPTLLRDPDPKVRRNAIEFRNLLNRLFSTLEKMGPGPIMDGLSTFQQDFFTDLRDMVRFLKDQRAAPPITLDMLPEQLKKRGLGNTGKIMLRIYPKSNVWEREPLDRFVRDVQKVDPNAVGTPILTFYHTEALKQAYEVSGWYAFAVICLVLLVHFRSIRDTLLALLPKVMGILWMLGCMAYFEVPFNPANFIALPLVLGIGLVFGVHVLHRAQEEKSPAIFSRSTGPAIVLDALTNIAGFGSLMFAAHQGIASLGFVMAVGTVTNLLTGVIVLPCVLQILRNWKIGF